MHLPRTGHLGTSSISQGLGHLGTRWGCVWANCHGDFLEETSASVTELLTPRLGCLMFLGCSSSVVGIGSLTDLLIGVSIPILCSFISKVLKTSRNLPVISTPLLLNITTWCVQAIPKVGCYETINNNIRARVYIPKRYKVPGPGIVSASQTFKQQWSRTSSHKKSEGKHQYHPPLCIACYCE